MKLVYLRGKWSNLYNEKNEDAINTVSPQIYKPILKFVFIRNQIFNMVAVC